MKQSARGYTLIELMIVLAVLGVLAAMAMPMADITAQRSKEAELKRCLWEIRDALDAYKAARVSGAIPGDSSAPLYPPSLDTLVEAIPDARPIAKGQVLRFLRRVPRDPFADNLLPASETWGLRSYLSEASKPSIGADVYDVYSKSSQRALNGTSLKDW